MYMIFKEFNFEDIWELFPQVRQCDVLLLDKGLRKIEQKKWRLQVHLLLIELSVSW
jgi:hypothetical protein